jgi:hypothetical protein
MHRRRYLWAVGCLTLIILGCGDTPHVVLRDVATSWNELADLLYEIPDDPDTAEEVAGRLLKRELKALKVKFEEVKKRVQNFQKADKEQSVAVNAAIEDLREEGRFAGARVAAQGRLRAIIAKVQATGRSTPNLEACASFPGQLTITLPSHQKKFPNTAKYGDAWKIPGGDGGGVGGGRFPGGPGGGPGGRPPGFAGPGP